MPMARSEGFSGDHAGGAAATDRFTQPDEVADLILFLASDSAANIARS